MAGARQRLDKWLFFARILKSRTLAAKLVESGGVRVNREKASQPSHPVKAGDVLTISLDRRVLVYKVVQPGMRRGPAEEARGLYEDLSPPPVPKEPVSAAAMPIREPGSGRPTKKERRATDWLRSDD